MRILFMLPKLRATSEPWMARMLEGVRDQVVVIAAGGTGGLDFGQGAVPVVDLHRDADGRKLSPKPRPNAWSDRQEWLAQILSDYDVTHVLCQYGTLAVEYLPVWRESLASLHVHFHGMDATFDLRSYERPELRVYDEDYRDQVCRLAKHGRLIANSDYTRGMLLRAGVPENRVVVKRLGVKPAPWPIVHQAQSRIRVACVGRLADHRDPVATLQAFERAVDLGLDGELLIAGAGPLRVEVSEAIKSSSATDRVRLLGLLNSEQVIGLLMTSQILTQHNAVGKRTRLEESLGVSIIEAMGVGLPVVGTRSGGVPELVEDGVSGILVEPGDIDSHARALTALAGDHESRNAMGRAGWERVRKHLSAEREANELKAILAAES